jgi:Domain of unknown function (DUF1707)
MSDETGPLRIGTAERTSAMKALDAHLEAGRLGVEEYGDRSAKAASASLASELTELFTDLPAPHPEMPGTDPLPAVPPQTAQLPVVASPGTVAQRGNAFLDVAAPRVMAVMPFVALALFFTVGGWWWFLLIPAAGALLYGSRHNDDDDRARDERRRERRDRRRDR